MRVRDRVWYFVVCTLPVMFSTTLKDATAFTCNGSEHLCNKRFNQVTYPTSHNAQSNKRNLLFSFLPDSSNISNQNNTVMEQLQDGIRGMKIPVHSFEDQAYACHGMGGDVKDQIKAMLCSKLGFLHAVCSRVVNELNPCSVDPAAERLETLLSTVRDFLEHDPSAVVTLFLEDYTNRFSLFEDAFNRAGLTDYLYAQNPNEPWSTLGEMIQTGKRLVVFLNLEMDRSGDKIGNHPGFNPTSYYVWGSKYHFETPSEIDLDAPPVPAPLDYAFVSRNDPPKNKMWLLQHFITPHIGGSENAAKKVNRARVLKARIQRYQALLGSQPNFVWVDFYERPSKKPGIFDVVDELNQG